MERIEERVKRVKSLGHGVYNVSSRSVFFPIAPITFTKQDLSLVHFPHDDPLIITLRIEDCVLCRMLVDEGSSVDILFLETLRK